MGAWAIFVFAGIILFITWVIRSVGDINRNHKSNQRNREIIRQPETRYTLTDGSAQHPMRRYVDEFEYAHKWYYEHVKAFRAAHPIGSVYDYISDRGFGRDQSTAQSMLLTTVMDQKRAFELEYRTSPYGLNFRSPQHRALNEARQMVLAAGGLPDNVRENVSGGIYDAGEIQRGLAVELGVDRTIQSVGSIIYDIFPDPIILTVYWSSDIAECDAYRTSRDYIWGREVCEYLETQQNIILAHKYGIQYEIPSGFLNQRLETDRHFHCLHVVNAVSDQ